MGQRIHGAIGRAGQQAEDQQEAKKGGHRVNRFGAALPLKNGKTTTTFCPP
jgi:hypothetical protein